MHEAIAGYNCGLRGRGLVRAVDGTAMVARVRVGACNAAQAPRTCAT
ncbi:MAG: hypothetical protein ACYDDF_08110 [Thermoplasmatota archaeon]